MDGQRQQPLPVGSLPWESRGDAPMAQGGPSPSAAQPTRTAHGGGEATLLEEALERQNMLRALQRVERNGGAPGVDGRTVEDFRPFLRRGHRFVRYADDCNIYVRTQRAGERVLTSVRHWIETRLKLRVNRGPEQFEDARIPDSPRDSG